jgi:tRNA-dihydrouridine synthase A
MKAIPTMASAQARTAYNPWRLCVAPMMDWTDRHCRYFHRLLSPNARLYTEMVVAQAAIFGDRERLLGFDAKEHPVALQLGGSEPKLLAQAAKIGADFGYDEINLNCGCPSDRVQSGRFGACLMREADLVGQAVRAMQDQVSVPVSVKCRLGVDEMEHYDDFRHFIDVVSRDCSVFIVHARKAWLKGLSPKENREVPPLKYEFVHRLKAERPDLTIVLNGGLETIDACQAALKHPDGALDGVMLGRAAYHTPLILNALEQALFDGEVQSLETIVTRLQRYAEALLARQLAPRFLGRHILGLFSGVAGTKAWRQALTHGALPQAAYEHALRIKAGGLDGFASEKHAP